MSSRLSAALVVLLAVLVVGGTAWGYVDWRQRVADQVASAPPVPPPSTVQPASPPSEPATTSLWIGDGYTAGYACPAAELLGWTCEVVAREGVGFVAARGGRTVLDGLADVPATVDPDVVVVDAGRNDLPRADETTFRAAVAGFLDALRERYPDSRLVQVVPWTLSQDAPPALDVATVVAEVAADHGGAVVDPVGAGWAGAGATDAPRFKDPAGGPSRAGDAYIARQLADALRAT